MLRGILVAASVLTATPAPAPPAAPTAQAVLVRWEYQVLNYNRVAMFGNSDTDLKLLGLQGWELVSSVYDPNARTIVCFLKRPLPQ